MTPAIFGLSGPRLTAGERAFLREARPWGLIVFARNIEDPDQLRALVADARDALGRRAPVLIDQEGGTVRRLRPPHWPDWRAPAELDDAALEVQYHQIGRALADLGIDVNCAPMADVLASDHPIVASRCYGRDVETVVRRARLVTEAMAASGIHPVLKHIPGHGRATVDSHDVLPVVDLPLDRLEATDFEAFRRLNDLPMGMTAHILYPALDPDRPATTSPSVIAHIRRSIGFDGLLMTDDLGMSALTGSQGDRAAAAWAAGCDLALHCNGDLAEMAEIAKAAPALQGEARRRAEAIAA